MSEENGLPLGWAGLSLDDICANRPNAIKRGPFGSTLKKEFFVERGIKVYEQQHAIHDDFTIGRYYIDNNKFEELKSFQVHPMDLLISCSGTIGKIAIVPEWAEPGIINQALLKLTLNREIVTNRFFRHLFQYLSSQVVSSRGTGMQNLAGVKELKSVRFPIPPMPEQQRIVAKLEELFSDLDAGVAALKRAQANLKRYRAAVLKAAVEGRLTEKWRAEHSDVEPADKLLARILTERRRHWIDDQLTKWREKRTAAGWTAAKITAAETEERAKITAKYKSPAAPDTTNLPDLPSGWCWATPDQLSAPEAYSLAIGPFGSNLKVSDYRDAGVPLIFVRHIRSGRFNGDNSKFISLQKAKELAAHSVRAGDILITKMGDPPGDAILYPIGQPTAIITADCVKFRPSPLLSHPSFFAWVINSDVVHRQIMQITRGVAQKKVSLGRFSTISLPLAPLHEQENFVDELEERWTATEANESTVDVSLVRASRLRQSILKLAFEGQLVPQDPNDEPAAVLLDRIRATRDTKAEYSIPALPRSRQRISL